MGLFLGSNLVSPAELKSSVDIDDITITENSQGKIQTIAVKNQNEASGATNPMLFWEGTEAEYNNGGGSTTYYNWESAGELSFTTKNIGTSVNFNRLLSVAFGNNTFVAVGGNNCVMYSNDNTKTWNETSLSFTADNVVFGNNIFVAFRKGYTNYAVSTNNGVSWTEKTSSTTINNLVSGNNIFVIMSGSSFYTSSDADTWTLASTLSGGVYPSGQIAFANGKFGVSEIAGSRNYNLKVSTDCISWTLLETKSDYEGFNVYGVGNNLYWIGDSGAYISTDGETVSSISNPYTQKCAYGDNLYVSIVGNKLQSSTDGITFTDLETIGYNFYNITFGNGIFLLVGGYDESSGGQTLYYQQIGTYSENSSSVYTTDENPTTASTVYSAVSTPSALTITSIGTGTITCSDSNTYSYNSSGNQIGSQTVGEAHPDWLCFIEGVGIKKGNIVIK